MDTQDAGLHGRRILVVEDEYLLADEIARALQDRGAEIIGPAPSIARAKLLIEGHPGIDSALLDVNIGNEKIWPVVDILLARDVLVVLTTGYDEGAIPPLYAGLPRCEKPVRGRDLARALNAPA